MPAGLQLFARCIDTGGCVCPYHGAAGWCFLQAKESAVILLTQSLQVYNFAKQCDGFRRTSVHEGVLLQLAPKQCWTAPGRAHK